MLDLNRLTQKQHPVDELERPMPHQTAFRRTWDCIAATSRIHIMGNLTLHYQRNFKWQTDEKLPTLVNLVLVLLRLPGRMNSLSMRSKLSRLSAFAKPCVRISAHLAFSFTTFEFAKSRTLLHFQIFHQPLRLRDLTLYVMTSASSIMCRRSIVIPWLPMVYSISRMMAVRAASIPRVCSTSMMWLLRVSRPLTPLTPITAARLVPSTNRL